MPQRHRIVPNRDLTDTNSTVETTFSVKRGLGEVPDRTSSTLVPSSFGVSGNTNISSTLGFSVRFLTCNAGGKVRDSRLLQCIQGQRVSCLGLVLGRLVRVRFEIELRSTSPIALSRSSRASDVGRDRSDGCDSKQMLTLMYGSERPSELRPGRSIASCTAIPIQSGFIAAHVSPGKGQQRNGRSIRTAVLR